MQRFIVTIIAIILVLTPQAMLASTQDILNINKVAPVFNLQGYNNIDKGKFNWSLTDFKGKWIVLYFYPQDSTPGCTIEAKKFEELSNKFDNQNALIVGISNNSMESHISFCDDQNLHLTLLSDTDGIVSKKYSSWQDSYSKRNTFLIDPNGIIKYSWQNVNASKHPKEVLNELLKQREI
ncbi:MULTISPECIES: peroxiredoxin [unclassified Prochlorococcus]|uniref:peroxiredoxin n=2 Tax=unclassified Prochlorococcus TaxID=2627481 RepID=UPI001F4C5E95|nr:MULTISPECIES: peroxiredoxin [unclassified Prochlorococcus]